MPVVAVDAMGGDDGAPTVVQACKLALAHDPDLRLLLVGKTPLLQSLLRSAGMADEPRLELVAATEVVAMDEEPAQALRNKKDSSMRVALNCVKEGRAGAAVSAGNTGAWMATARFVLKMIPGIDRPAIMAALPSARDRSYLLDLGANAETSAEQLLQFARMGSAACVALSGIPSPRIGLLNIGSEAVKGNSVVKAADQLIRSDSALNYAGFVEGDDIYAGSVDVVVCDGFTGNVMLKSSEGLARLLGQRIRAAFMRNWYGRMSAALSAPVLRRLRPDMDPGRYNGASLVGLRGVVIKSHGGADARAYANSIHMAARAVGDDLPQRIAAMLEQRAD